MFKTAQQKKHSLGQGEELVVRREVGDSYGGLPGLEIFVNTSNDPEQDEREETRLPTPQEFAAYKAWVLEAVERLLTEEHPVHPAEA